MSKKLENSLREILEGVIDWKDSESEEVGMSPFEAISAILKLVEEETRELQIRLKAWEEKYPCCDGKPTCANNRTSKFVNDMLGGEDWNDKKDYLYSVIESLETEAEFQKIKRHELESQLAELKKQLYCHEQCHNDGKELTELKREVVEIFTSFLKGDQDSKLWDKAKSLLAKLEVKDD